MVADAPTMCPLEMFSVRRVNDHVARLAAVSGSVDVPVDCALATFAPAATEMGRRRTC
jgi:hypothetical protein